VPDPNGEIENSGTARSSGACEFAAPGSASETQGHHALPRTAAAKEVSSASAACPPRPMLPTLRIVPPSRKVRLLKLLLLQVAILSTTSACTALEDGSDTDPALDFAFEGKPFNVQWEFAQYREARWEYTPTELTMVCDQTSTEAAETQPFVDCVL
jgi:hypothetical protein